MYRVYIHTSRDKEKDFVSYQLFDVQSGEPIEKEQSEELWKQNKLADHAFVMEQLRVIVGKVLTIIDASIADKRQNKAMKDLVRQAVSDQMTHFADMMVDQREMQKMIDEIPEEELDTMETVDVFEAVGIEEDKQ